LTTFDHGWSKRRQKLSGIMNAVALHDVLAATISPVEAERRAAEATLQEMSRAKGYVTLLLGIALSQVEISFQSMTR
jgi:hypothetical protein